MRVAWFGHVASERRNGLVSYSRDVVNGLRHRGHEVMFFYHAARERAQRDPNGIRIGSLDIMNRVTLSAPRAKEKIVEALQRWRPSVAHISIAFSLLDFSLADVCHSLDIPVVATMHFPYGPPDRFWGEVTRLSYRVWANALAKCDAVIVFSQNQGDLLARFKVPTERIHIIPNGVDVSLWSPGEPCYKDEIGASLVITYLGRVDPEKNVDVLIESFEQLQLPADHKLVIVGDGLDYARLKRKYSRNEQVLFLGFIREAERKVRVLQGTDIFVLPSEVEGLSISMLEGMASGCAVIATDVGSDGDALRGTGVVVDLSGLDEQLPLALRTLIEFPTWRRELGDRARIRAVAEYSMEDNLNRLVGLYDRVYDDWHSGI
ncbi:MAG TPA: glycosyltransferase family 4 protein [Anaerolineae bacterium]